MNTLTDMIYEGNIYEIREEVEKALNKSNPEDILESLVAGLKLSGESFQKNEYFVVEMMQSAEAYKRAMEVLKPKLSSTVKRKSKGRVVIGTVEGDIHDIGKNLVSTMLEGAGFEIIDLGVDISADDFISAIKKHEPDILGLSALLTTTMLQMENIINTVKENNLRDTIKIIVGGAPVSERYANSIGADMYGLNEIDAVEKALKLVKSKSG